MPASKPRIVLFIHCFPPALGGLEYFAGELRDALNAYYHVTVITGQGKTLDSYKTFTGWIKDRTDVDNRIYRLPLDESKQRWANRILGRILRLVPGCSHWYFGPHLRYSPQAHAAIMEADCIIGLGMPTNMFVESARWANEYGKPLLVIPAYHDVSYFNSNSSFRTVLAQAKRILCLSPYEQRSLMENYPVTAGKTTLLPFSPFTETQVKARRTYPPTKKTLRLGFIGQISRRKRLYLFPEIMDRLQTVLGGQWDISALLAGAKTNESPLLERDIHHHVRNGRISIQYNFPDKEPLYDQITVFVNPSMEESLGIVNLEAMQHGIPVFSANPSPFAEMAPETAFENPTDLAGKIGEIILNPDTWQAHVTSQYEFLQTRTRSQFVASLKQAIDATLSGTM